MSDHTDPHSPTIDRLRRDIDPGRTGDRATQPAPDPAAAPPEREPRKVVRLRPGVTPSAPDPDGRHKRARPALPIAVGLMGLALLLLFAIAGGG